jgi:hypothetical protein
VIPVGSGTVAEVVPAGWMLEVPNCSGASGGFTLNLQNTGGTFTANYGDTVLCSFVNVQQQGGATRTQGYWSTHTALANAIWTGPGTLPPPNDTYTFNPVAGSADEHLCKNPFPVGEEIDANPAPGMNEVMGGFWANIAQTTSSKGKNKGQRSDLDKARMQLLQQYLAAVLNVHAFGTPIVGTDLATARAAYCGSDPAAILAQAALLAAYNESGDIVSIDITGYKGTPQQSREQANIPFWDITFR